MPAFLLHNRDTAVSKPSVAIHGSLAPERHVLEKFIHERYAQVYGANVAHYLPWLLALQQVEALHAVVGLRPGASGAFFVEQYLDSPIETLLSQKQGVEVPRAHIVETGNLAAARGGSPLLFLLLTEVLYRANFRWITFTATSHVNSLLQRLGMRPERICMADVSRLGEQASQWGSYYDSKPSVLIGDLECAYRTLQDNELAQKTLQMYATEIDIIVATLAAPLEGFAHA
ncbi:MAG: thermostable hemolysin [Gammaproteobacteria bacterium]